MRGICHLYVPTRRPAATGVVEKLRSIFRAVGKRSDQSSGTPNHASQSSQGRSTRQKPRLQAATASKRD